MSIDKSFEAKLRRIYEVTGISSDSALARVLSIKAPSVAAARKRRQIPGAWIEKIAETYNANANWLLFGLGEKLLEAQQPAVESTEPAMYFDNIKYDRAVAESLTYAERELFNALLRAKEDIIEDKEEIIRVKDELLQIYRNG